MHSVARDLAILAVVGGVVLFTNLGGPRLWDRDEPRNAGCALEMRERGDWITPWFNDELRSHKPVLLYWLILTAYSVFGVSEFSARFWSAALGVGSVWLTYALGRRLFSARAGLWAGLILCSTLMFDVAARAATPDSVLLFCVTLALTLFVCGEFPVRAKGESADAQTRGIGGREWNVPLRLSTAVAMYAAMGLAVLAKGPVGAVLPTAVVGMFLLVARLRRPQGDSDSAITAESMCQATWSRRAWSGVVACVRPFAPGHFLRTCWDMRPLVAIGMIFAVAGPWYIWVGLRTEGEFLRGFFWQHNVARAVQSFEGHRGGLWFYPVAICVGFFPWSVFASPLVIDLKRRWRILGADAGGVVFALCWAGVWIGIFSIARTKLPSYVTPAYPALALLTAEFVARWSEGNAAVGRWWARVPLIVFGVTGACLLVALPFVARRYLPGAEWLAAIGVVPLTGAAAAWRWLGRERSRMAAAAFATAAIAFSTLLLGVAPQVVDRYQQADQLLAAIERFDSRAEVAALGGLEPSWVFYGGRPIREVTLEDSTFIPGIPSPVLQANDDQAASPFLPKPIVPVGEFLEGDERRVVIAHGRQMPELRKRYGDRLAVLAEAPKFLRNDRLYVVTLNGERSAREPRPTTVQ